VELRSFDKIDGTEAAKFDDCSMPCSKFFEALVDFSCDDFRIIVTECAIIFQAHL
jgi:hypothetical protein